MRGCPNKCTGIIADTFLFVFLLIKYPFLNLNDFLYIFLVYQDLSLGLSISIKCGIQLLYNIELTGAIKVNEGTNISVLV